MDARLYFFRGKKNNRAHEGTSGDDGGGREGGREFQRKSAINTSIVARVIQACSTATNVQQQHGTVVTTTYEYSLLHEVELSPRYDGRRERYLRRVG